MSYFQKYCLICDYIFVLSYFNRYFLLVSTNSCYPASIEIRHKNKKPFQIGCVIIFDFFHILYLKILCVQTGNMLDPVLLRFTLRMIKHVSKNFNRILALTSSIVKLFQTIFLNRKNLIQISNLCPLK